MSESAVRINTKIETKDANAQLLTLENRIVKVAEKANKATHTMEELGKAKIPTAEYEALCKEVAKGQKEISKTGDKILTLSSKLQELGSVQIETEEYTELKKELSSANREAEKLGNKVAKLSEKGTYNSTFKDAQYEYMEMRKHADSIEQRMHQLEVAGSAYVDPTQTEKYKKTQKEILSCIQVLEEFQKKQNEISIMEANGIAFIDPTTTDKYKKAEQDLAACNREMEILNLKHAELKEKQEQVNFNTNKLLKRIKDLAIRAFVFTQITKAFRSMVSAMQEGLQDLAQYSKEYNANMSEYSSATTELKYNLASMAEPVLNTLIPAFTTFVGWVNTAVEAVTKFLSAMSGKSTYTKAKKQVIDYAKGVSEADKATKGALASFDDLNVLSKASGNDSADGAVGGADAFEEVQIESEFVATVQKIKGVLEAILPLVIFIGAALATWKLASFLETLMKIKPTLGNIVGWLVFIIGAALTIYNYLKMWDEGVDWPNLIGYISGVALMVAALLVLFGPVAAGIALIVARIAGVILALKDICENGVTTENMALLLISAFGILAGVFMVFGAKAAIIVGVIMTVIGVLASLVAYSGNGEEALGHLKDAFGALGDFVSKIFTGDIEGAFESLKEAGKSFGNFFISVAEGIANGFIKMVNAAIDAINSLSFDVPDWLQGITGMETFGFNIPHWDAHVKIQRLANGGITTGSTLANIGEAGREAVLPLENNTGWMDDLAQKLADKMPNSNQTINLVAELDGREVYRSVVRLDKQFYKTTGKSQFSY